MALAHLARAEAVVQLDDADVGGAGLRGAEAALAHALRLLAVAEAGQEHARGGALGAEQAAAPTAVVPPEVPELPAALQTRPALLAVLRQRVLRQGGGMTAVVATSKNAGGAPVHGMPSGNTTCAYGMGGTGSEAQRVEPCPSRCSDP